jgi:hypothetical protein
MIHPLIPSLRRVSEKNVPFVFSVLLRDHCGGVDFFEEALLLCLAQQAPSLGSAHFKTRMKPDSACYPKLDLEWVALKDFISIVPIMPSS